MKGRPFVDGKLRAAQPGRLSAFVETSADTSHPNQTCVGEGFIPISANLFILTIYTYC